MQELSYVYDALGNVTQRSETTDAPVIGYAEDFRYDQLNRPISAHLVDQATQTVAYYAIGCDLTP